MAFYNSSNDYTNFSIGFTCEPRYDDFGNFAKGYKFAANLIAEELIESSHFPDYQAFPIVFLYRHALELHLKNIIYRLAKLSVFQNIEDVDTTLYRTHDLIKLSEKAYQVITEAFPEDESIHSLLEQVVEISKEFNEIDSDSYTYRYPIDLRGNNPTKPNQIVNLRSLATHMDNILSSLEDIDFGLQIETYRAQEVYELLEKL